VEPPDRYGGAVTTAPGHHRGFTAVAAAGLAVTLLAACTPTVAPARGAWYGDATDVRRAQAIWADPWVAPTTTHVAAFHDLPSGVLFRDVGRRAVVATAGSTGAAAVAAEVEAATHTGRWVLVGANCKPADPTLGDAAAWLSRTGAGLDAAATAVVSAGHLESGAVSGTLTVFVPHHLDRTWPRPAPLDLALSCLAGAPATSTGTQPERPGSRPLSDEPVDEARDLPQLDAPAWTPGPPADLAEARAALTDDPVLTRLGAVPAPPGDSFNAFGERNTAQRSVTFAASPGPLAGQVEQARAAGWRLTYAACLPAPAAVTAELQRAAGSTRYAVLRLTAVRSPGGDTANAAVVSVDSLLSSSLSLPAAPAISGQPCWATAPAGATGVVGAPSTDSRVSGAPAFGPTLIQPLTGVTVSP